MTVYYADPSNVADDTATGLKYTGLTVDSTADTTHLTDSALSGMTIPAGSFVWNSTRGAGSLVTSFSSTTIVLTTAITGMAAGDSYYLITPWKTFSKICTTLAAGDTCYIRAGTTCSFSAAVSCTNDGTISNRINVIGLGNGSTSLETTDGTATEAWHTGTVARPIMNHNTYRFEMDEDQYWQFHNLQFSLAATSNYGDIYVVNSKYVMWDNCRFTGHTGSYGAVGIGGLNGNYRDRADFVDCIFDTNAYGDIDLRNGIYNFIRCSFASLRGVNAGTGSGYSIGVVINLDRCVFTSGGYDINAEDTSYVLMRDCTTDGAAKIRITTNQSIVRVGNHQRIQGNDATYTYFGAMLADTSVVRTGGATSSAKMIPSSNVDALNPLSMNGGRSQIEPRLLVWCPAEETTITVYVRGLNWATFPTAAQLFLQADYLSNATSGSVAHSQVKSTQVLTANDAWVAFSVTVTPAAASFVELNVFLGLYEDDTTGIYVDIKPVLS